MSEGQNEQEKIRNFAIERNFLAGLVRYSSAIFEVEQFLSEQDFASPVASKMFGVFRHLIIDKNVSKLDSALILATVSSLGLTFPPSCNITDYVHLLFEGAKNIELKTVPILAKEIILLSKRREMYGCGTKIHQAIMGHQFGNIQEIIATTDEIYFDTINNFVVDDDMVQLGAGAGEMLNSRAEKPVDHVGFSSGFKNYDELIGYIRPDSFNFISARAKVGKSIFGLNVARYVAQVEKYPVFYADSEMGNILMRDRLVSHVSGVDINLIENGKWRSNPEICSRIERAIPIVESLPITYFSIRATNVAGFISACRRFLFRKVRRNAEGVFNPCLFVWDYIKTDYYSDAGVGANWWLDMAKSVVHFKDFLGKTQTAALVLGQQNRTGITKLDKDKKMITMDDESTVAGSDEIVKTASNISQVRFKTAEEIKRDGSDTGNCLLMPFACRTGRGGAWVQLSEGIFEREYVCLERKPLEMTFKELTTNRVIRAKNDLGPALK